MLSVLAVQNACHFSGSDSNSIPCHLQQNSFHTLPVILHCVTVTSFPFKFLYCPFCISFISFHALIISFKTLTCINKLSTTSCLFNSQLIFIYCFLSCFMLPYYKSKHYSTPAELNKLFLNIISASWLNFLMLMLLT